MLIELPIVWIILVNVAGWPVIQFGLAWLFMQMPVAWFNPGGARAWEQGGRFYERVFGIKRWKDWLPDAARWFGGGFAKGTLLNTQADYLRRFIRETWRGELCHWCALGCSSSGIRGGPTWLWSPTRWRQICPASSPSVTTGCDSNGCLPDVAEQPAGHWPAGSATLIHATSS